ncbi:hypothetical protein [Gracilimonas tropica]|uniref:hypothetical protein n=1 Tax=Gracilimonas tropica TaxID=454600 RepID=UPI000362DDFA|nr:hypothetical protein [Gracilimonas tropica]
MTIYNKGLFSLCTALIVFTLLIIGCENPGSVGSEYVNKPKLTFDTLNIEQAEALSYNSYSGRLGFIPIGQYSDALFGDIVTKGLFKPNRTPPIPDSVDLDESFALKLKLNIDSLEVYGDTLSTADFTVHEITSNWRGNALTIDDEITVGEQVGQFSLAPGQREVTIDLAETWVDEYKSWYYSDASDPDSLYNYEFKGLALVSDQANSRISFARSDGSSFIMINGVQSDTTDTIGVSLQDYGFVMDRGGAVNSPNTFPIHTTLEGMYKLTMPVDLLRQEIQTSNIIKADVIVYEVSDELENTLPANHQRLGLSVLNLDVIETLDPEYEYQFGQVDFRGGPNEDGNSFTINITNYVNNVLYGSEEREELILGAGSASGAIRSSLFYGTTASEDVRPKIIITSLED